VSSLKPQVPSLKRFGRSLSWSRAGMSFVSLSFVLRRPAEEAKIEVEVKQHSVPALNFHREFFALFLV
jgi:hypothetical protein